MEQDFIVFSKRKDANQNAEKILEAAKKVFARKGHETTIEEVAQAAGVGVGTVYRRFNNKEQLASAVAYEVISETYEEQVEILLSDRPTVEKIREIFAKYAEITSKHGQIHGMIVDLLNSDTGEAEMRESFLIGLRKLYTELITSGQSEGIFRDGDPRIYELYLQNMINPQMVKNVAQFMPLEQTPSFLADLALNGLVKDKA